MSTHSVSSHWNSELSTIDLFVMFLLFFYCELIPKLYILKVTSAKSYFLSNKKRAFFVEFLRIRIFSNWLFFHLWLSFYVQLNEITVESFHWKLYWLQSEWYTKSKKIQNLIMNSAKRVPPEQICSHSFVFMSIEKLKN